MSKAEFPMRGNYLWNNKVMYAVNGHTWTTHVHVSTFVKWDVCTVKY